MEVEEAASLVEREVSMRLMKRESRWRVTEELSLSLARRRLGQQERTLGVERSFLGCESP